MLRREVSQVVPVLVTLSVLSGAVDFCNILCTPKPTQVFSSLKFKTIKSMFALGGIYTVIYNSGIYVDDIFDSCSDIDSG